MVARLHESMGFANQFLAAVAGNRDKSIVDIGHDPLGIGNHHDRGGIKRQLKGGQFLKQPFSLQFCLLEGGDVFGNAREAINLSLGVANGECPIANPTLFAIGPQDPIFLVKFAQ